MNLIEHKKARFDYEILEAMEAGIELLGFEVKSLRARQGTLEGAHIVVRGGEAYVLNMSIPPYQAANTPKGYDSLRTRRLLLTKKELSALADFEGKKGLTVLPIAVYSKGRTLKVAVVVARGRKRFDKRAVLKKRDAERDMERTLKNK